MTIRNLVGVSLFFISITLAGPTKTALAHQFAEESCVARTAQKLALPLKIVSYLHGQPEGLASMQEDRCARNVASFFKNCFEMTRDQLRQDPACFRKLNALHDECRNLETYAAVVRYGSKELCLRLKQYVKTMNAVNRSLYTAFYARSALRNGPSDEIREMMLDQLATLQARLFGAALCSSEDLSRYGRTMLPRELDRCLTSVALTPQRLALHNQLQKDEPWDQIPDDERSYSSIAGDGYDGDKTSVRNPNRFEYVLANWLVEYEKVGTCVRLPEAVQAAFPELPMFQFVVNRQEGPTCAYHAAANARALKALVAAGQFPSAVRLRHWAQRYESDMQSFYECDPENPLGVDFFEKALDVPYDVRRGRTKEGRGYFLNAHNKKISAGEAYEVLKKNIDEVSACKSGAITCECVVSSPGERDHHAVVCALAKPKNRNWMFVYMDSNNTPLDRAESYLPDACAQVISNVRGIKAALLVRAVN